MYLTHRQTTIDDLQNCLPLIRNGFVFDAAERLDLIKLWRHLLSTRTAVSAVIIDHESPPGNDIVGFGLSVFVNDEFVVESRSALPPYQPRHILHRWTMGRSPILDRTQIGRANSGEGLNVVVMHHGWRTEPRSSKGEPEEIKLKLYEAFMSHHAGFQIKHFQQEIYGEAEMVQIRQSGCRLQSDYATHIGQNAFSTPPADCRPYLMTLSRDDVLGLYNPISLMFKVPRARFGFTSGEQEVLQLALEGKTDEEIAALACRSIWAIKKRWQGIFGRVDVTDGDLLVDGAEEDGQEGQHRRRRLLQYIRLHPEELRPTG